MKERLKRRSVLHLKRLVPNLSGRRVLGQAGRLAVFAVGSGVLSALPVAGAPVPLAACIPAVTAGADTAASILGCVVGYLLRWGVKDGLWSTVLAVILPVISLLVQRSNHKNVKWLCPAACTAAAGAVGLGFLWQLHFPVDQLGRCFLGLLIVFGGTYLCAQAVVYRKRGAVYLLGTALLAALSVFTPWHLFNPGICAALFLTAVTASSLEGIAVAAICGIVLELTASVSLPYTAFFCLCSAACYTVRRYSVFHRGILLLLLSGLFAWLAVEVDAQLFLLSAVVGSLASLALPRLILFTGENEENAASRMRQQLQKSSDVLLRLHDTILLPRQEVSDPDAAAVFDHAADQVCRNCANWAVCWEQEAATTYHALCDAAAPILEQGRAAREDFSPDFISRCQYLEAFIQSVNTQLDAIVYRRQFRSKQYENRELLRSQYLLLARFMQATADTSVLELQKTARYEPEVAAKGVGKSGKTLSGDRGACFHGPGDQFYVLLCDGMGTGRQAASESSAAIETLSGLLRAGLDPDSALQLLNGAYVLRDNGCFSTVDLLQVNLSTGDSLLLKWGAAPSYLKRNDNVRKLGEATLPPGLCVNGMRSAQRIRLTLQLGDLLVLTSDGASVPETERRISEYTSASPKELTASIIAGAEPGDDITAVAVCLHEVSAA